MVTKYSVVLWSSLGHPATAPADGDKVLLLDAPITPGAYLWSRGGQDAAAFSPRIRIHEGASALASKKVTTPIAQNSLRPSHKCTTDIWVLTIIQTSYSLQFKHGPPPLGGTTPKSVTDPQDATVVSQEVAVLLQRSMLSTLSDIGVQRKATCLKLFQVNRALMVMTFQKLLGLMAAASQTLPLGLFCCALVQQQDFSALSNHGCLLTVSHHCLKALSWWKSTPRHSAGQCHQKGGRYHGHVQPGLGRCVEWQGGTGVPQPPLCGSRASSLGPRKPPVPKGSLSAEGDKLGSEAPSSLAQDSLVLGTGPVPGRPALGAGRGRQPIDIRLSVMAVTRRGRGRQPIDIRLSVMAVTRRGLPIESITGAEALVENCGDGEPQKKKRATEQSISSSRGETLGSPVYER
ncbi:UNVERIFIED_CONTAM: hypothetical protein FKN15_056259 [Acipenser sinensis]